jgi:hypothetical protein
MTDFGADEAFAGAAAKLKEHYGIVVPVSAVRGITEEQGATVLAQELCGRSWNRPTSPTQLLRFVPAFASSSTTRISWITRVR